jgi:2-C-methyl-D-erythritol 4-phosphate cytidylyltransferase
MGRPKQFIELLGESALLYTLRAFEAAPGVRRIYTVGERGRVERLAEGAGISKYAGCSEPGESRSLSTLNGLRRCGEEEGTVVLVQDGSRCLVTPELVERVIRAARGEETPGDEPPDGVIPTLPVSDTVKVIEGGVILKTLDRTRLGAVQTPQAFPLGVLRRAYGVSEEVLNSAPDDAFLVERVGGRVVSVMGEKTNIKLTTPEDLVFAEAILKARALGGFRGGARSVREARG